MNTEVSIGDLAEMIMNIMNVKLSIIADNSRIRPKGSEVDRLVCDNSKLLKNTSWKAKYDLKKGLEETISWLMKNKELYKPDQYNV